MTAHILRVAVVAVAVGVGFFAGYLFWGQGDGSDPFATPVSTEPPGEYLYLDSSRVATYLSQLEDGLKSGEIVTLSRNNTIGANATAGGLGLQGTTQSQRSLQETVTPTAASLFYRLEARLRAHDWLQTLSATPVQFTEFRRTLANLDEGSFVLIHNCRLVLPAYADAYRAFKTRIPSLPLTLTVEAPDGSSAQLLFPVAYNSLANEPSLFSTRLTVLGKIIRQVDAAHPSYIDVETRAAFNFDLEHTRRAASLHSSASPTVSRLEQAFSAAVRVDAPGAVILPIAIFK